MSMACPYCGTEIALVAVRQSDLDSAGRIKRHSVRWDTRQEVFERDGYACRRCGASEHLSIDHILPVSKGGTNHLDNLQTLCRSCNSSKGARL